MAEPPKRPEVVQDTKKDKTADAGKPKIDADAKEDAKPAWWALLALVGTAALLLVFFTFSTKWWPVGLVLILLGATALAAGAFLGFLFGMPRPAADGGADSTYRPSTNLEQVSDWLTKILIGAGLVQLAGLRDGLAGVGTLVSRTVTPPSESVGVVAQLAVVIFLVIGFLASFLWTRLYYGGIQTLTDRSLAGVVQRLAHDAEGTKEGIKFLVKRKAPAAAVAPAAASTPGDIGLVTDEEIKTQLPPKLQGKLDQFMKAPRVWNSDPNARIFQHTPQEDNGRRLDGEIVSDLDDILLIKLKVTRVAGDPLEDGVLFLLHPTFPERVVSSLPRNDVAETSIYAEGTFTAVAIADNGNTVLAYDLAKLKGAPKWFREG